MEEHEFSGSDTEGEDIDPPSAAESQESKDPSEPDFEEDFGTAEEDEENSDIEEDLVQDSAGSPDAEIGRGKPAGDIYSAQLLRSCPYWWRDNDAVIEAARQSGSGNKPRIVYVNWHCSGLACCRDIYE